MITILGYNVRDTLDKFLWHFNHLTAEDRYCRFFSTLSAGAIRDWLIGVVDSDQHHTFIVSEDAKGNYTGIAQLAVNTVENTADMTISVIPEVRGKGVAKALVSEAIDKARFLKLSKITFQCELGNIPCRKLYESLGFTTAYDSEQRCVNGYLIFEAK